MLVWAELDYRAFPAARSNRLTNGLAKSYKHVINLSPFVSGHPFFQLFPGFCGILGWFFDPFEPMGYSVYMGIDRNTDHDVK